MKHQYKWFLNRIGREIYTKFDLFNPPIKIASEGHARALYYNQTKGYTYHETKP